MFLFLIIRHSIIFKHDWNINILMQMCNLGEKYIRIGCTVYHSDQSF